MKFWGQVTAIHASRLHLYFVYINSAADDADVNKYYVDNDVYDGYGNDDKCEDYGEYSDYKCVLIDVSDIYHPTNNLCDVSDVCDGYL
ncbi:hypothetical protein DPMN_014836 [Dreissena polymorpha]|uniref:Uncharacterized protein n=1 Tax=Dreissena polymorpha TaxID=45954 RepID=A0A9D4N6R4_DREPO|nr:hypothetical protein DPMN_014836 [Dreissena polymorpha]